MTTISPNRYWTPVILILIAVIVISSILAWSKYRESQAIEISMPPGQELQGELYVGGAASNPGFYPLRPGDTLEGIIQAAGGTIDNADLGNIRLYIPHTGEEQQPQKIDLNRAEAWLLQALPGIGEVKAQAIIAYRQQNKGFHSIEELTKVEGIGATTFERIKNLVTVAD